jgi:tRNA modification GTPase
LVVQGEDTIAAVATPFGEGAIALLRVSGPRALPVAAHVLRVTDMAAVPNRKAMLGRVHDQERVVDEVVFTAYRAPASYTGEDCVEIACHGGILVTRTILDLLLQAGARLAEPGEFTQRAFLNGKMDLTQAEAVMDLISARTQLALRSAAEQLEGRLGERVETIRGELIEVVAHLEAYIDFPDEDIDPESGEALAKRVESLREKVRQLLATADQGRLLREGIRTVIAGRPNVGKSSLLNRLLGYERAIVSPTAGTTRDTLEESLNLRGIPLRLIDTAGLRESGDEIEREGIARTRKRLDAADIILEVFDGSQPQEAVVEVEGGADDPRRIQIVNKIDLGLHPDWAASGALRISCETGEGFDALLEVIHARAVAGCASWDGAGVAINARHQRALTEVDEKLGQALQELREGSAPDFIAVTLREALAAAGEVTGKIETDEIIGKIFSTFCLGK